MPFILEDRHIYIKSYDIAIEKRGQVDAMFI